MIMYPLFHILFYFAVLFAPENTVQITVPGPTPEKGFVWNKEAVGWVLERDDSVWWVEGKVVCMTTRANAKTKSDKKEISRMDVSGYVGNADKHDWKREAVLTIDPKRIVKKSGSGYLFIMDPETEDEQQMKIAYKQMGK